MRAGVVGGGGRGGMLRRILHLIRLKTRLFRYGEWKGEAGSSRFAPLTCPPPTLRRGLAGGDTEVLSTNDECLKNDE